VHVYAAKDKSLPSFSSLVCARIHNPALPRNLKPCHGYVFVSGFLLAFPYGQGHGPVKPLSLTRGRHVDLLKVPNKDFYTPASKCTLR